MKQKILILDSYYYQEASVNVGVIIDQDENVLAEHITYSKVSGEYIPGEFYKRELPGLKSVLEKIDLSQLNLIIVDGYVQLNENSQGLGFHLYKHLNGLIPVIGVAKNYYHKTNAFKLLRGKSKKPLYISSIGIETEKAVNLIKEMKGTYRIPDVLRYVDSKTRQ